MKLLTLTGLASGIATLLAGTAAAQAYGAYNPHDVFVSADVLRGGLRTAGGSTLGAGSSASYYAASAGISPASYSSVSSVASGGLATGVISAPITASISGPMSGTFTGQITGTITGNITLNSVQPAPVVTSYVAPTTYVAPPAPIYTPAPAPAPIYVPPPVVVSEPVYVEPVYVPPPPPPPPIVAPVIPVVAPIVDACSSWGDDRNFYGQIGGGYAYAGRDVDGVRLRSRNIQNNYHVSGGLGLRLRGQGVGCDDHVRLSLQNQYIVNDLRRGGQALGTPPRTMLRNDHIDTELVFATVEYAPDFGLGGVRPYVGVGIGAGGVDVGDGGDGYKRDWNVAYKGVAGVTFEVNPKLDLFAEYNYIAVPGVDLKTGSGRHDGKIDYDAHLVNLGLRYNF